jgi:hypothetical protein
MATKQKMITAVFRDRFAASAVYDWLLDQGYRANDINVLMTEKTRNAFHDEEEPGRISAGSKAPEGAATGGAVGAVVGATAAAIAAIGTSMIVPGLGWIVAGPVYAALAGGGAGALAGGVLGALVGLGIPESNATAYEEALRNGGIVIGVVPRNDESGKRIKKEFEDRKGENIVWAS